MQAMTEDVGADPTIGDVLESSRSGDMYQIIYVDEQIVLLRCNRPGRNHGGGHRMEKRTALNDKIEAGQFEHRPDSDLDMLSDVEVDWAEVDYIGDQTTENMHEAGVRTVLDVQQANDDELLDIDGLGNGGLSNLREFAQ